MPRSPKGEKRTADGNARTGIIARIATRGDGPELNESLALTKLFVEISDNR